jgi:uncharacterized protein
MNCNSNSASLAVIAIGHSVRALTAAIREISGLRCLAVDYYGDADTRELATDGWLPLAMDAHSRLVPELRSAIADFTTRAKLDGLEVVVLLAGGMENHLGAMDQLASCGRLLAPSSLVMRDLRSLHFWRDWAEVSGLEFPETCQSDAKAIEFRSDQWLWKPASSAGGVRIMRGCDIGQKNIGDAYWQRFIDGRSIGVTCILSEHCSTLVGATESLSNQHWPAPSEFIYRGSVGPIELTERARSSIIRLCECIRQRFGLLGWIQFDFVQDCHESLWLIEFNPRWTAGMEVLVDVGINPVAAHLSAWGYPIAIMSSDQNTKLTAKAIVYATEDLWVDRSCFADLALDGVRLSDVPFGWQRMEKGSPIATLKTWIHRQNTDSYDHQRQRLCQRLNERRVELIEQLYIKSRLTR